jgi:hypothetical protein
MQISTIIGAATLPPVDSVWGIAKQRYSGTVLISQLGHHDASNSRRFVGQWDSYNASGAGWQNMIVMPSRNLVAVHRVDTDAGHSVDETSIGTLLWMILDAAGEKEIGDAPLLKRTQGTRLTADTLPQALQACTLQTTRSGAEIKITYRPDGTFTVSLNEEALAEARWWLDGDNYCHDLGPENGGRQCFQVLQNGDQLVLFDLDGYALMRFECAQQKR